MKTRNQLMQSIQKYDFALYDLMLYLDTHTNCQNAMRLYRQYRNKREEAVEEYVKRFGPINALQSDTKKCWNWGNGPYPWEKEAN